MKKYTLHIGIWAGKRAAIFPLFPGEQTGKSHLSTKLDKKTPNLEVLYFHTEICKSQALLEKIPHDGTVIRFYKMLQHIFTRKTTSTSSSVWSTLWTWRFLSLASLAINLLSLRTVNTSSNDTRNDRSISTTLDPYVSPWEALQHVDAWRKESSNAGPV